MVLSRPKTIYSTYQKGIYIRKVWSSRPFRYTTQPYGTSSSSLFRRGGRRSQFHESRAEAEDGAAALEPPDPLPGKRDWRAAVRATLGKSLSNRRRLPFLKRSPLGAGTSGARR